MSDIIGEAQGKRDSEQSLDERLKFFFAQENPETIAEDWDGTEQERILAKEDPWSACFSSENFFANGDSLFEAACEKLGFYAGKSENWKEDFTLKNLTDIEGYMTEAATKIVENYPEHFNADEFAENMDDYNFFGKQLEAAENSSNPETTLFYLIDKEIPALRDLAIASLTIGSYSPTPIHFIFKPMSDSFAEQSTNEQRLVNLREFFIEPECVAPMDFWERAEINDRLVLKPLSRRVMDWLESFGIGEDGWRNFVRTYMFEDYVDENWNVIPFWPGHAWRDSYRSGQDDRGNLPAYIADFNAAIEAASDRVYARGRRMVAALREAMNESPKAAA